jgi:hypothetical protein
MTAPTLTEMQKLLANIKAIEPDSWGQGFVESLINQVDRGRTLSPRQVEVYNETAVQYTEEARHDAEKWPEIYKTQHREDALKIAAYYMNTPYYNHMSRNILHRPDYVPPLRQYKKMVGNKYAQRVLDEYSTPGKYTPGALVMPRATAPWRVRNAIKKGAVIIRDDLPIKSAAKGARTYSLLPIGGTKQVEAEERHLKVLRRKK